MSLVPVYLYTDTVVQYRYSVKIPNDKKNVNIFEKIKYT